MCADRLTASINRQGVTSETAGSSETGFAFNDVIAMLIVDIFVYAVLAWYATNVRSAWTMADFFRTYRSWSVSRRSLSLSLVCFPNAWLTEGRLMIFFFSLQYTFLCCVVDPCHFLCFTALGML